MQTTIDIILPSQIKLKLANHQLIQHHLGIMYEHFIVNIYLNSLALNFVTQGYDDLIGAPMGILIVELF